MGSAKIEIIDSSSGEKAVVLNDSSIARPINLPPRWQMLKIGVRFIMSGSNAASITGMPRFYLGMCSGSNIIGDSTTDFFMGFRSNTATWTYTSSSTYTKEYFRYATGQYIAKIGTNITASSDPLTNEFHITRLCGVYKPMACELSITRSLTNMDNRYRLSFGFPYSAGIINDGGVIDYLFINDMQSTPIDGLTYVAAGASYSLSGNGQVSGSVFDKVIVGWDREDPSSAMAILDLAVTTFE